MRGEKRFPDCYQEYDKSNQGWKSMLNRVVEDLREQVFFYGSI